MRKIIYNDNLMETNCYLLEFIDETVVIDPVKAYDKIPKEVKSKIKKVFITHGHFDHFIELESYKSKGITFYMHSKCLEKISNSLKNCSYLGYEKIEINLKGENVNLVKEGDYIEIEDKTIKVIELLGHTNCSIGFILNDDMFCGDAIFLGSIGRTDLYSGDASAMKKTIQKVKMLKKDYTLYPGHGDATTLYDEIKTNNYFK